MSDHMEYPQIEPVRNGAHRPFWSVMIPIYNRTQYLERALRSVLQQDPGPGEMQIEVVDDCSTQGNPEEVVNTIGQGRVTYYRQPAHVSMSANWNTCIERARGSWIHILHDDDMVLPEMYATYRRFIETHPDVMFVFSPVIFIDTLDTWTQIVRFNFPHTASGLVENALMELVKVDFICASAAVVARAAYVKAGGFSPSLSYSTDWEMWMRIACVAPIGYITHPYVLYRDHAGSASRSLAERGKNIEEIIRTIETGVRRLSPPLRKEARTLAHRSYSFYSNILRGQLHASGEHGAALFHAWWGFKLSPSIRNFLRFIKSGLWCLQWLMVRR